MIPMLLLLAGGLFVMQGSLRASDVYYAEGNINVLELLAIKVRKIENPETLPQERF